MINIKAATLVDIDAVVYIHQQAFPDFFLTTLGSGFLKLYYKSVLTHPRGILLVSENESGIIGFCAGTMLSAGFNSRLIKANLFSFTVEGLKVLFTRPVALWHLYKNMSKENSSIGDKGEYAELLSIGVNPNTQRTGAGRSMLLALEEGVKKRGGKQLSLTTDYNDNEKAIGFYQSLGYREWYDFVTYPNRRMYRLIKDIED
jgi:ribosomal protein S18 acetylase RimI-like enzyme